MEENLEYFENESIKVLEKDYGFETIGDTLYIKKLSHLAKIGKDYKRKIKENGVKNIFVKDPDDDSLLVDIVANRLEFIDKIEGVENVITAEGSNEIFVCENIIYCRNKKKGTLSLLCSLSKKHNIIIPDGVVEIKEKAFMESNIRSVKFPDSLRIINEYAFYYCTKLEYIEFGKGKVKIGTCAFCGCLSLESVDMENVSKIKEYAFYNCVNLDSVTLHEGLKRIKDAAFSECINLQEISIPSSVNFLGYRSLDCVNTIHLLGDFIPQGIDKCSSDPLVSVGLTVHFQGKTAILPKSPNWNSLYGNEKLQKYIDEFESGTNKTAAAFRLANAMRDKQELALAGYSVKPDPETKLFLLANFQDMLNRRKKEKDFLDLFERFSKNNLLTKKLVAKALPVAQERNWTQASAYVLKIINEYSKKEKEKDENTRFSL